MRFRVRSAPVNTLEENVICDDCAKVIYEPHYSSGSERARKHTRETGHTTTLSLHTLREYTAEPRP